MQPLCDQWSSTAAQLQFYCIFLELDHRHEQLALY